MEAQKILEQNILLADFIGGEVKNFKRVTYDFKSSPYFLLKRKVYNTLHFHESWDWLMPVIMKIKDSVYRQELGYSNMNPPFMLDYFIDVIGIDGIEGLYQKCYNYIKNISTTNI